MTEWQPIETAPEGETIFVYPDLCGGITFSHKFEGKWLDEVDGNFEIHPTHWMPLPEPPK